MIDPSQELGPVSEGVVRDSVRITQPGLDEVRRITLLIDDPAFRFMPGQSIGVVVPGPHPLGNAYHMRRYSIASGRPVDPAGEGVEIELLVRRCFYVDEVNGERYPGIASNFLCDAGPGERITVTGPYRSPFRIPDDRSANLLMIGTGTGVAPFRAFVQAVYRREGGWDGQVRLYYGARNGMDLLYGNDAEGDLANYYDEPTFKAFRALISRPLASEADSLAAAVADHAAEIWDLMRAPGTHVFVAGLGKVAERFDQVMQTAAGSPQAWREQRDRLRDEGRWSELIYS